jgi:hypothetical protein
MTDNELMPLHARKTVAMTLNVRFWHLTDSLIRDPRIAKLPEPLKQIADLS